MRLIVLATTPGEMVPWRGMFAVWVPQRHIHLVWMPLSDLIEQPGPVRMRSVAIGNMLAVLVVNETSGNVTLVQITYAG